MRLPGFPSQPSCAHMAGAHSCRSRPVQVASPVLSRGVAGSPVRFTKDRRRVKPPGERVEGVVSLTSATAGSTTSGSGLSPGMVIRWASVNTV
jgi:hypothetical protein